MDLATILGLVIGTALVLASMFIEASAGGISMLKFWSTSSMMIVLGGTVAAIAALIIILTVVYLTVVFPYVFNSVNDNGSRNKVHSQLLHSILCTRIQCCDRCG